MTLNDWADVSAIVQAVIVILSLGFIWYQLQQNTKLAKAANIQALTEQAAAFNALLYENEELCELWYSYGKNLDTKLKRQRYREMMVQWLIFHQNIYYQRRQGLLEVEIYQGWLDDLKGTIKDHDLEVVSANLQGLFPGAFGQHLAELSSAPK
jgi:hypothetical protein